MNNPSFSKFVNAKTYAIIGKLKNKLVNHGGIYMTATWEKKEGNEGVLTVTVPAEKVNKALDQAFKKWSNKLMCLDSVKVKCLVQFLSNVLV